MTLIHISLLTRGAEQVFVCLLAICVSLLWSVYPRFFPILIFIIIDCCCYSVAKLYPTLCTHIKCNTPGFPVPHCLPEFAQTHVHWVSDAIQSSYPLLPTPSSCSQCFPTSQSFPMHSLFTSSGQSIDCKC